MIEDADGHNFIEKTRNDYIHHVLAFGYTSQLTGYRQTLEDRATLPTKQKQAGVLAPSINAAV